MRATREVKCEAILCVEHVVRVFESAEFIVVQKQVLKPAEVKQLWRHFPCQPVRVQLDGVQRHAHAELSRNAPRELVGREVERQQRFAQAELRRDATRELVAVEVQLRERRALSERTRYRPCEQAQRCENSMTSARSSWPDHHRPAELAATSKVPREKQARTRELVVIQEQLLECG